MCKFFAGKFAFIATFVLFTCTSAFTWRLAHAPSVPPDPWDGVRIAHAPSVPPDPWDGVRLAHAPSVPPDPWDGVRLS
jgi:hypothetical protein